MVEYFEHQSVSQSRLKALLIHPLLYNRVDDSELYYEEKKHFIIGDGVDILVTQNQEVYDSKFHVSRLENKPSDTIKSIVNMVFDNVVERFGTVERITMIDYREIILDACDNHVYQVRWNEDTRVNKICEAWQYWEDLKLALGKQVISIEEDALISSVVMSLKTSEATAPYFIENRGQEILYQLPIFFEYEGVECKALLDMVKIDHNNRTIQPIDIKTMGDHTINFVKSLKKRRYDIQAAFYTQALEKWKIENGYGMYLILPFKFIVESTINVGTPMVFTMDTSLLNIGKYGRQALSIKATDGYEAIRIEEIKGFAQLIELYKYYTENGFEIDQIVREHNSEFTIDWSGIIV